MKIDNNNRPLFNIGIYIGVYYILGILIQLLLSTIIQDNNLYMALTNFIIYLLLAIGLIFINQTKLVDDYQTLKKDRMAILNVFVSFIIVYLASYISEFLVSLIEEVTSDNQMQITALLKSNYGLLMFLSAGIFGPLCEELVFRAGIMDIFKKREIGIVVSSFIFALVHIVSSIGQYSFTSIIIMFIPYLASGLAFGFIYYKSKSIWYSIIAHSLYNILAMVLILIF